MTTRPADITPGPTGDAAPESYAQWVERVNCPRRRAALHRMVSDDWEPAYERWRHGGSYVVNLVYPTGAVGCIASARHTVSGKFEIACQPDAGQFSTRRAAAFAEREIAIELWRAHDTVCAYTEG